MVFVIKLKSVCSAVQKTHPAISTASETWTAKTASVIIKY
jgi:hypothetical protein